MQKSPEKSYGSPIEKEIKIDVKDVNTWPKLLQDNLSLLNVEEKTLVKDLLTLHQQHLFATWDPPGINDDLKHSFFEQVRELNKAYPGGIAKYVKVADKLLHAAKRGENPLDGWRPEVPSGVSLEPVTEEYLSYENVGISQLGACGFVLVAGGLGERLGYNGIKVELPFQTVTNSSYLELYCHQIAHIQARYAVPGVKLPLAIMTSDDTHAKTQSLLEANHFFGLDKTQVTLLKQGKVPALISNSAHIGLSTAYTIDAKPHGHGDIHSLMHTSGTARRWKNAGLKYAIFFQDTNGLAFYTLPAMLGVSERLDLEVNSLAVDRKAKQAVGALTKLVHADGRSMTVNVEYNQLDPLLRATINPEGDVNHPDTGLSIFPGNINQLAFKLEPYVKVLNKTEGVMPEFVNPKYKDKAKNIFKKATRLECMMQDYPRLLGPEAKVGFTVLPDWICYAPMKNNAADAAASFAQGVPAASAYTAESAQYYVFGELLRRMGSNIAEPEESLNIQGISAKPSPRIVFHPSFAIFPHEVAARFPHPTRVTISANSTLVIEGNVRVDHLVLNGSTKISAAPGTKILVRAGGESGEPVTNKGHVLKVISPADSLLGKIPVVAADVQLREADLIRGYVLECVEMCQAVTGTESTTKQLLSDMMKKENVATADMDSAVVEDGSGVATYIFNGKTFDDEEQEIELPRDQDTTEGCCMFVEGQFCCGGDGEVEEVTEEAACCAFAPEADENCCSLTSCLVPELAAMRSRQFTARSFDAAAEAEEEVAPASPVEATEEVDKEVGDRRESTGTVKSRRSSVSPSRRSSTGRASLGNGEDPAVQSAAGGSDENNGEDSEEGTGAQEGEEGEEGGDIGGPEEWVIDEEADNCCVLSFTGLLVPELTDGRWYRGY